MGAGGHAGTQSAFSLVREIREFWSGMLVLGGLTSEELRETVQKVPGLGDIPLLGNLFKSRGTTKERRNLLVFLKPTIARDAIRRQGGDIVLEDSPHGGLRARVRLPL